MKSDKHIELTRKALVWLKVKATARGVRGCEEVILDEGYVADGAAICGLQIQHGKKFVGDFYRERWSSETSNDYSWVFETKVSRSDFRNTFVNNGHIGNRLIPIANFHFIVTPRAMLTVDDVPTFWGLLEESGAGLSIKKMPEFNPTEDRELFKFAYKVLRYGHARKFTLEVNENMMWP